MLGNFCIERPGFALVHAIQKELRVKIHHLTARRFTIGLGAELHGDLLAIQTDSTANTFLAQSLLDARFILIQFALCRCRDIDFKLEVHATAQIQSELHRRGPALY